MGTKAMLCVLLVIVQTKEDMVLVKRAKPLEHVLLQEIKDKLMLGNDDYDIFNTTRTSLNSTPTPLSHTNPSQRQEYIFINNTLKPVTELTISTLKPIVKSSTISPTVDSLQKSLKNRRAKLQPEGWGPQQVYAIPQDQPRIKSSEQFLPLLPKVRHHEDQKPHHPQRHSAPKDNPDNENQKYLAFNVQQPRTTQEILEDTSTTTKQPYQHWLRQIRQEEYIPPHDRVMDINQQNQMLRQIRQEEYIPPHDGVMDINQQNQMQEYLQQHHIPYAARAQTDTTQLPLCIPINILQKQLNPNLKTEKILQPLMEQARSLSEHNQKEKKLHKDRIHPQQRKPNNKTKYENMLRPLRSRYQLINTALERVKERSLKHENFHRRPPSYVHHNKKFEDKTIILKQYDDEDETTIKMLKPQKNKSHRKGKAANKNRTLSEHPLKQMLNMKLDDADAFQFRAYRFVPTSTPRPTTRRKTLHTDSKGSWRLVYKEVEYKTGYPTKVVREPTPRLTFKGFKFSKGAATEEPTWSGSQEDTDLDRLLSEAMRRAGSRVQPPHFENHTWGYRRGYEYLRWKYAHGIV